MFVKPVGVRVSLLEDADQLDRERVGRWEELGGLQAISANALSVPAKTEFYADLLAGVVSTEAPEPIDVESFLATLQSLSVSITSRREAWRAASRVRAAVQARNGP